MSKFVLKIPVDDLLYFTETPEAFDNLKSNLDSFIKGDQKYLILPSGEGYLTEIDGEGKVTEWEVQAFTEEGASFE